MKSLNILMKYTSNNYIRTCREIIRNATFTKVGYKQKNYLIKNRPEIPATGVPR